MYKFILAIVTLCVFCAGAIAEPNAIFEPDTMLEPNTVVIRLTNVDPNKVCIKVVSIMKGQIVLKITQIDTDKVKIDISNNNKEVKKVARDIKTSYIKPRINNQRDMIRLKNDSQYNRYEESVERERLNREHSIKVRKQQYIENINKKDQDRRDLQRLNYNIRRSFRR